MAARLRTLPVWTDFDIHDIEVREAEILLIVNSRTVAHRVADELRACGYRVLTHTDPFQAMAMALRSRPQMVIVSAVLQSVTGIDVLRAFAAMGATAHIPLALLTSFSPDHAELQGLPQGAGVIRLGQELSQDLAQILSDYAP
jgi:DNA-binding response OmpR family regulator